MANCGESPLSPLPPPHAEESAPRAARFIAALRRYPSAVLLITQLLTLLVYPMVESRDVGRTGVGIFGIVVLGMTLRMVQRTPFKTWIGLCLALPAVGLLALQAITGSAYWTAWTSAFESALYFYAAGSLIAYMVDDRRATPDELFAAAGTFTLIAWAFAYLFMLTQTLQPGSFAAATEPQAPRSWTELMFLSFALLSSTGIGDVVPVQPVARGLAAIEMFAGVMYLASVVTRLMGLTLQQDAPAERFGAKRGNAGVKRPGRPAPPSAR